MKFAPRDCRSSAFEAAHEHIRTGKRRTLIASDAWLHSLAIEAAEKASMRLLHAQWEAGVREGAP